MVKSSLLLFAFACELVTTYVFICVAIIIVYVCIVLWCINSGCCCSEIVCKTWEDYFSDTTGCRSNGAVDRLTTELMSLIPFSGLSNFYKGNKFDGWCEVINAVMAVISILAACSCHTHDADCIAAYIAIGTILLDFAKIIHMIAIGSADTYEIVIMITSIIFIYLYCCAAGAKVYGINPATLIVTIATGALETFRDIYTAAYNDKDGNDCPFI